MVVPVRLDSHAKVSYDIVLDKLPMIQFDTQVAIVTNPTVSGFHLDTIMQKIQAPKIEIIEVPDGEEYKTLQTVMHIHDRLFQARFDRTSKLIAFGGGVVGDMTGFAASIYQRGIGFVQIPTTLLSQVDASVGGKTGVNTPYGKNLIGSFYQPEAVYIDTAFLETLPAREFHAGVAEVIKMAVMFDAAFFEYLESHDITKDSDALKHAIRRCIELKADVVNRDEKEQGIRAVLNYGHTFGHVIEAQTLYKQYLHGEAVAIGMVMANALAVALGLLSISEAQRIKALLERYHLQTHHHILDIEEFYEHFYLDKKVQRGKLAFILPHGIGGHTIRRDIDKKTVISVLESLALKRV